MNFRVMAGCLLGNARAIQEVARNRSALWTGIVLVLLTGIARNYDQNYFLETPMWLVGPLVFSFFSGSFLYWVLVRRFAGSHFPENDPRPAQWPSFMALFWMTAPIAWLYALPVERLLDPYPAAQANLVLLGTVSLWRVLLMSRILEVLFEISFFRALGWVLVAASLEIILVLFFGAYTSGSLSRSVLAAMAGMRNSPEEALLSNALGLIWAYSWAVLLVCIALLARRPFRGTVSPLPKPSTGRLPWLPLATLAVIWVLIAIPPQLEQRRYVTHAEFVEQGNYSDGLTYLAQYQRRDFPPARRLKPDPYVYRVWQDLPPTIGLLTSNTPAWIRHVYLSHLTATLSHPYARYDSLTNVAVMFSALEQLPEGRDWLLTNQLAFTKQDLRSYSRTEFSQSNELTLRANILNTLRRMGMAETNLARLTNPER
jgi:hypothetical protein